MRSASRAARFQTRTGSCSLRVTAGPGGLELLELNPVGQALSPVHDDHPVIRETLRQLGAYFAGELKAFDLPLDPKGTEFQRAVWEALLAIPYGETRTYGEIARAIGKPAAVRAVGAANGSNPIAIIIPCHRVIGVSGKLVGFGGGLPMKRMLLDLETEHAHLFGQAAAR